MKLKSLIFGMIISLSLQSFSREGGYSGGGGDHRHMGSDSAWFLGTQEIQYCIQRSPKFVKSEAEINSNFISAVQTWKKYIQDRKVHSDVSQEIQLNLNYRFTGNCQGTEDLRLIFGIETAEVQKAKKQFQNPYSFAIRESYDVKNKMGKGFIWFDNEGALFPLAGDVGFPNWSKPYTLHGMMLHELGHVLGIGHVDGTIMSQNMISTLQFMDRTDSEDQKIGKTLLTHIDHKNILYFNLMSSSQIVVDGRFTYRKDDLQKSSELFKLFVDREPVGKVKLKFLIETPIRFQIADDKGSYDFVIPSHMKMRHEFVISDSLFKTYFLSENSASAYQYSSVGISGIVFVTSRSGQILTLQYSINSNSLYGPVVMSLVDKDEPQVIFYSN